VGEDLRHQRRLLDGGDDSQVAPAPRAVFQVQVEDALQEPGPAQARRRAVRVTVCRDAGILCRARHERRTQLGVGGGTL